MSWSVYIILTSRDTLYTGITTDIERRWQEHSGGSSKRGAKYFNGCKPVDIVYLEDGHDRSSASRREARIKSMTKAQKRRLIEAGVSKQALALTGVAGSN